MALIKCEECGQTISDKAGSCPNCGCPIEKSIICEECGQKLSINDIKCPNCGCPVENVIICKDCGQRLSEDEKKCNRCGCPVKIEPENTESENQNSLTSFNGDFEQRVQHFLLTNTKYLPQEELENIRTYLISLNDSQLRQIEYINFKDPTIMLIISWFLGYLGIDRFMIGDTILGLLKLLTCGGCGIWWLIDFFLIMDSTKDYNYNLLKERSDYV